MTKTTHPARRYVCEGPSARSWVAAVAAEEAVPRGAQDADKLHAFEMDRGKTNHVCMALQTLRGMCLRGLREAERKLLDREAGGRG